jgi:hypothetical protein
MRTTKELLEIMLENQDYFSDGLCHWIDRLYINKIISPHEKYKLKIYIEKNKPFNWRTFVNSAYYWKPENIKPRIKWIKKHIKKLS